MNISKLGGVREITTDQLVSLISILYLIGGWDGTSFLNQAPSEESRIACNASHIRKSPLHLLSDATEVHCPTQGL